MAEIKPEIKFKVEDGIFNCEDCVDKLNLETKLSPLPNTIIIPKDIVVIEKFAKYNNEQVKKIFKFMALALPNVINAFAPKKSIEETTYNQIIDIDYGPLILSAAFAALINYPDYYLEFIVEKPQTFETLDPEVLSDVVNEVESKAEIQPTTDEIFKNFKNFKDFNPVSLDYDEANSNELLLFEFMEKIDFNINATNIQEVTTSGSFFQTIADDTLYCLNFQNDEILANADYIKVAYSKIAVLWYIIRMKISESLNEEKPLPTLGFLLATTAQVFTFLVKGSTVSNYIKQELKGNYRFTIDKESADSKINVYIDYSESEKLYIGKPSDKSIIEFLDTTTSFEELRKKQSKLTEELENVLGLLDKCEKEKKSFKSNLEYSKKNFKDLEIRRSKLFSDLEQSQIREKEFKEKATSLESQKRSLESEKNQYLETIKSFEEKKDIEVQRIQTESVNQTITLLSNIINSNSKDLKISEEYKKLQVVSDEFKNLNQNLKLFAQQNAELEQKFNFLNAEYTKLFEQFNRLKIQSEQDTLQLTTAKDKNKLLEQELNEKEEEIQELQVEKTSRKIQSNSLQSELSLNFASGIRPNRKKKSKIPENLQSTLTEYNKQILVLTSISESKTSEIEALKKKNAELEEELKKLKNKSNSDLSDAFKVKGDLDKLIEEYKGKETANLESIKKLSAEIDTLKKDFTLLQSTNSELEATKLTLGDTNAALEARKIVEIEALTKKIEELNKSSQELVEKFGEISKKLQISEENFENEKKAWSELEKELRKELQEQLEKNKQLDEKLQTTEQNLRIEQDLREFLKKERTECNDSLAKVKDQVSSIEKELESSLNEMKVKQEAIQLLAGENSGIKLFLKEKTDEFTKNKEKCDKTISDQEKENFNLQKSIATNIAEIEAYKKINDQLQEDLKQKKNQIDQEIEKFTKLTLENEDLKTSKKVIQIDLVEENKKFVESEKLRTAVEQACKEKLEKLQSAYKEIFQKNKQLENERNDVADQANRNGREILNLNSKIKSLEEITTKDKETLTDLTKKYITVTAERDNCSQISEENKKKYTSLLKENEEKYQTLLKDNEEKFKKSLSESEANLETLRKSLESKDSSSSTLEQIYKKQIEDSKERITNLEKQIEDFKRNNEKLIKDLTIEREEKEQSFKKFTDINEKWKNSKVELEELNTKLEKLTTENASKQEANDKIILQIKSIEAEKEKISSEYNKQKQVILTLASTETEKITLEKKLNELTTENSKLKSEKLDLEKKLSELTNENSNFQSNIKQMKEDLQNLTTQLNKQIQEIQDSKTTIIKLEQNLQSSDEISKIKDSQISALEVEKKSLKYTEQIFKDLEEKIKSGEYLEAFVVENDWIKKTELDAKYVSIALLSSNYVEKTQYEALETDFKQLEDMNVKSEEKLVECEKYKEKVENFEANLSQIEDFKNKILILEAEKSATKGELQSKDKELKGLVEKQLDLEASIEKIKQDYEDEKKGVKSKLEQSNAEKQQENAKEKEKQQQEFNEKIKALQQDLDLVTEERKELTNVIDQKKAGLFELENELSGKKIEIASLTKDITDLKSYNAKLQEKLNQKKKKLLEKSNQQYSNEELIEAIKSNKILLAPTSSITKTELFAQPDLSDDQEDFKKKTIQRGYYLGYKQQPVPDIISSKDFEDIHKKFGHAQQLFYKFNANLLLLLLESNFNRPEPTQTLPVAIVNTFESFIKRDPETKKFWKQNICQELQSRGLKVFLNDMKHFLNKRKTDFVLEYNLKRITNSSESGSVYAWSVYRELEKLLDDEIFDKYYETISQLLMIINDPFSIPNFAEFEDFGMDLVLTVWFGSYNLNVQTTDSYELMKDPNYRKQIMDYFDYAKQYIYPPFYQKMKLVALGILPNYSSLIKEYPV
jgi:chromosome segregation ATPase